MGLLPSNPTWRRASDFSVRGKRRRRSADNNEPAYLQLLVSLGPPVESLDVAAVNHQSLVAVSHGVSVLLQRQETQRPDNTEQHTL